MFYSEFYLRVSILLQVLRSSQVKHIQDLWEALSLRQSSLLIEMNQVELTIHFSIIVL